MQDAPSVVPTCSFRSTDGMIGLNERGRDMRVLLVLALGVVVLVFGELARAAPAAIQGVHGGGIRTFGGFTTKFAVNVTRDQSGRISGQIREDFGSSLIQASPSGL